MLAHFHALPDALTGTISPPIYSRSAAGAPGEGGLELSAAGYGADARAAQVLE